jgi:hypothetical protein
VLLADEWICHDSQDLDWVLCSAEFNHQWSVPAYRMIMAHYALIGTDDKQDSLADQVNRYQSEQLLVQPIQVD